MRQGSPALGTRKAHGHLSVMVCGEPAGTGRAAGERVGHGSSHPRYTPSPDSATTAHGHGAADGGGELPNKRFQALVAGRSDSSQAPSGAGAGADGRSAHFGAQRARSMNLFDQEDCVVPVLHHLDVHSVLRIGQVNRMVRRLCDSHELWAGFCLRDFGEDSDEIMSAFEKAEFPSSPGTVIRGAVSGSRTLFKGIQYKLLYRKMLNYEIELHFVSGPMEPDIIKVDGRQCTVGTQRRSDSGPAPDAEDRQEDELADVRPVVSIGRSRTNDISILQDEMVSRKHGEIFRQGTSYWFKDVGSINGTFINSEQVSADEPYKLRVEDLVEMGATRCLRVTIEAVPVQSAWHWLFGSACVAVLRLV